MGNLFGKEECPPPPPCKCECDCPDCPDCEDSGNQVSEVSEEKGSDTKIDIESVLNGIFDETKLDRVKKGIPPECHVEPGGRGKIREIKIEEAMARHAKHPPKSVIATSGAFIPQKIECARFKPYYNMERWINGNKDMSDEILREIESKGLEHWIGNIMVSSSMDNIAKNNYRAAASSVSQHLQKINSVNDGMLKALGIECNKEGICMLMNPPQNLSRQMARPKLPLKYAKCLSMKVIPPGKNIHSQIREIVAMGKKLQCYKSTGNPGGCLKDIRKSKNIHDEAREARNQLRCIEDYLHRSFNTSGGQMVERVSAINNSIQFSGNEGFKNNDNSILIYIIIIGILIYILCKK